MIISERNICPNARKIPKSTMQALQAAGIPESGRKAKRRLSGLCLILVLVLVSLLLSSCWLQIKRLKDEQFRILKASVSQILGSDYEVKKIDISQEGYSNEDKTEYVVDFKFDLNKPVFLFPGTGIPGKLIFSKGTDGEWKCTFNSGNPGELFNLLR